MTLPNPRTIYEIDPTGREDRAIVSRGIRTPSGVETVLYFGLINWDKVITSAANRHWYKMPDRSTHGWTGTGALRHA